MPANLTPMYLKAERDFRRAQTLPEQMQCLQSMLQLIPKHKGTDRLQGEVKAKLREVRLELQKQQNQPRSGRHYRIERQGAGRIVLLGAPNAGKTQLLNTLTGANGAVAEFPFTTREPAVALLRHEGVDVQVIDTPPITAGSLEPWQLNLVRTSDAIIFAVDGSRDEAIAESADVLAELRSRRTDLGRQTGFVPDQFATVQLATLAVVTHAADPDSVVRWQLLQETAELEVPWLLFDADADEVDPAGQKQVSDDENSDAPISAGRLAAAVFNLLNVIRVYTKPPGEAVDFDAPLAVAPDSTVQDVALQIHEDLFHRLRKAKLWRDCQPIDHDGMIVGREYPLRDGDILELH